MSKHVLILDDNLDNLQLLALCFATFKSDYKLHQATTGRDTLLLLEDTCLDMALLDIELPDADGLTLGEQLRRKFPGMTLIMLSANDEVEKLERARAIGASAYFVKPFNLSEILNVLRAIECTAVGSRSQMLVV